MRLKIGTGLKDVMPRCIMIAEVSAMNSIMQVASTIGSLLGIGNIGVSTSLDAVCSMLPGGCADRVLMYNPDAVAWWLFEKYRPFFEPVLGRAGSVLRMESVMPSVTPVCFASMYSGVPPEVHGIRAYVKPVLTCETIFDVAIRNGIRPAICSTGRDSISRIFLERDMDYFIFDTPEEVNAKAKELMASDLHRLVIAYNGDYDATMHKFGPESDEALAVLRRNVAVYKDLCECAEREWGGKGLSYAAAFATDHGCHEIDGGCGSHGLDMPEDMNVVHMWTVNQEGLCRRRP